MTDKNAKDQEEADSVPSTAEVAQEEKIQQSELGSNEPFSAGFFDKDPVTSRARKMYFKALIPGVIMVMLAVWIVLSIYWGAFWRTGAELYHFKVWVVDFDGGSIGSSVTAALQSVTGPKDMLTFEILPASQFPGGAVDLADQIHLEKAWAGVAINEGATTNLMNSLSSADSAYNGSLAITIYAEEARNENSYDFFLGPILTAVFTDVSQEYAKDLAPSLAQRTNLQTIMSDAPQLALQPLWFTIDNMKPFDLPVASAIDFVGLIYLLILSFIVAMINQNARTIVSGFERRLRFWSLVPARLLLPMISYFFVSLSYSVLSLAFRVPFNRYFGHGGFMIYWMLSWCGMMSLGLAVEAVITLVGLRFIPFFLILWIISNVSVSFFPIEILPRIYYYGYAMPFYNLSRAVRTILFGTKNDVGLNFGVLIAWIAVSLTTIPIFQGWLRYREVRDWRRQKEQSAGRA